MDHLCFWCIVFLMLLRLLIAALCTPAGKGLISWLLVMTFIVSFPDLCLISYFSLLPGKLYSFLWYHRFKLSSLDMTGQAICRPKSIIDDTLFNLTKQLSHTIQLATLMADYLQ